MKDLIQKKLISTCEMHCGGAPVRIIESGFPDVRTNTGNMQNCIDYLKNNLDHWRRMLLHEPRGHGEMVAALLLPPTFSDGIKIQPVIFMHHTGYWTMCGHMTLALARYFAEKRFEESLLNGHKMVDLIGDEVKVTFRVPCGLVNAWYTIRGPEKGWSRFVSVQAFVVAKDMKVNLANDKTVSVDIAYGGNYFAFVAQRSFGFEFGKTHFSQYASTGQEIQDKLKESWRQWHTVNTENVDVIFTDDIVSTSSYANEHNTDRQFSTKQCVTYDGKIDKSPCGSGSTARMALLYDKKLICKDDTVKFISAATNEAFIGKINEVLDGRDKKCITVTMKGRAHHIGRCQFTFESDDNLAGGFSVK